MRLTSLLHCLVSWVLSVISRPRPLHSTPLCFDMRQLPFLSELYCRKELLFHSYHHKPAGISFCLCKEIILSFLKSKVRMVTDWIQLKTFYQLFHHIWQIISTHPQIFTVTLVRSAQLLRRQKPRETLSFKDTGRLVAVWNSLTEVVIQARSNSLICVSVETSKRCGF